MGVIFLRLWTDDLAKSKVAALASYDNSVRPPRISTPGDNMNRSFCHLALATVLLGVSLPSLAQTVPVTGIVELSGPGATAGTNFDNGVKLAVKAINAAGGMA